MDHLPDENSKKFVAILNEKIPVGKLLNALGHMTAGLIGGNKNEDFCFLQYEDKDKNIHPNISHFPFIVVKAENSNQIRKARQQAIDKNILFTDFVSTMTIGTSEEQINATKNLKEEELEYYGLCLFGNSDEIKEITKKFSLFK
jgi:hypothetical protein